MDIVLDARLLLPQMTGIGRYLMRLAQQFRTLNNGDRIEMWLHPRLTSNHPIWKCGSESLRLRQVPSGHLSLRQQWEIPALLRRRGADLFHHPHFDLPFAVPGRVVVTIHDLKYITHPEFFPRLSRVKQLFMLASMRYAVQRAQAVITDSEYTRLDLLTHLSVPAEKVRVIHLGVDPRYNVSILPKEREDFRRRHQLPDNFVLFVGDRRPHKNLPCLIESFAHFLQETGRPEHLVIAGAAYPDYSGPEKCIEELNLSNRVHLLDYFPDAELPNLYQAASAFTTLSLYEGFGLPVLEAMSAGLPVIAAQTTCLPEIVGDAGLLVPPNSPEAYSSALQQALPGGGLREELIARGQARAAQFRWERTAQETLAVYHQAASR